MKASIHTSERSLARHKITRQGCNASRRAPWLVALRPTEVVGNSSCCGTSTKKKRSRSLLSTTIERSLPISNAYLPSRMASKASECPQGQRWCRGSLLIALAPAETHCKRGGVCVGHMGSCKGRGAIYISQPGGAAKFRSISSGTHQTLIFHMLSIQVNGLLVSDNENRLKKTS